MIDQQQQEIKNLKEQNSFNQQKQNFRNEKKSKFNNQYKFGFNNQTTQYFNQKKKLNFYETQSKNSNQSERRTRYSVEIQKNQIKHYDQNQNNSNNQINEREQKEKFKNRNYKKSDIQASQILEVNLDNSQKRQKNLHLVSQIVKIQVYSLESKKSSQASFNSNGKRFAQSYCQNSYSQRSNQNYFLSSSLTSQEMNYKKNYACKTENDNIRSSQILKSQKDFSENQCEIKKFNVQKTPNIQIKSGCRPVYQEKDEYNSHKINLKNQMQKTGPNTFQIKLTTNKNKNFTIQDGKNLSAKLNNQQEKWNSVLSIKKQLFVKENNPESKLQIKNSNLFTNDIINSTDQNFYIQNVQNIEQIQNQRSNKFQKSTNTKNYGKSLKDRNIFFLNNSISRNEKLSYQNEKVDRLKFQNQMLISYNNVLDINSKALSKTSKLAEKFKAENNAILKKFIK